MRCAHMLTAGDPNAFLSLSLPFPCWFYFLQRLFINAIIKFASIFAKSKVVQRIRFVKMEQVRRMMIMVSRFLSFEALP